NGGARRRARARGRSDEAWPRTPHVTVRGLPLTQGDVARANGRRRDQLRAPAAELAEGAGVPWLGGHRFSRNHNFPPTTVADLDPKSGVRLPAAPRPPARPCEDGRFPPGAPL